MNICWIVPASGEPHRRDVLEGDDKELRSLGFDRYRMVHRSDGAGAREAHVYVHHEVGVTNRTFFQASEGLWGTGGAIELFGPDGKRIWP
jgi:hypothetical protein